MSYEYTVFLSYHRGFRIGYDGRQDLSAAGGWVHDVLQPALRKWLPEHDPQAKIAFDGDFAPGARSEPALRGRLERSRCMLAVWSAPYFRSDWCRSEWHSMLARERLAEEERGRPLEEGLVIPLVFCDGEFFDDEARQRCQGRDTNYMQPFTSFGRGHEGYLRYPDFVDEVKRLCRAIVARAQLAPAWRPNFPWISPGALEEPVIPPSSLRT